MVCFAGSESAFSNVGTNSRISGFLITPPTEARAALALSFTCGVVE